MFANRSTISNGSTSPPKAVCTTAARFWPRAPRWLAAITGYTLGDTAAARQLTNAPTPLPNGLVGDRDPTLGQQVLGIAKAQTEAVVEPHGMTDDLGQESIAMIAGRGATHPLTLPRPPQPDNAAVTASASDAAEMLVTPSVRASHRARFSSRRGALIVVLLASGSCALNPFSHPTLKPYRAYQQRPSTGIVTATFLGTASVLFRDGNNTILTDPFVTRPSAADVVARTIAPNDTLIQRTLEYLGIETIDAIVAGHSHYDHAMDAAVFARRTHAVLIGSRSTENIGLGAMPPVKIDVVGDGDVRSYGQFRLTFIESLHSPGDRFPGTIDEPLTPPARAREWKTGMTWSILIQHEPRSLLVHGSANFKHGALKGHHADVVYLGIGGLGKQSDAFVEEYWSEVVRATGARRVILVHWDDFFRSLDKPLRPMANAVDSFPDSMRRLLQCGASDGVEVLLPVAWQVTDPFAGLMMPAPPRTANAPHPCRAPLLKHRHL